MLQHSAIYLLTCMSTKFSLLFLYLHLSFKDIFLLRTTPSKFLGFQTLVELYNCSSELIDNTDFVEEVLLELTNIVQFTVVKSVIHHFSPIGVSGVIVIEESHLTIHTWPEYNYVAIDFFTCNQKYDISKGIKFLVDSFNATKSEIKELKRGSLKKINNSIKEKHV